MGDQQPFADGVQMDEVGCDDIPYGSDALERNASIQKIHLDPDPFDLLAPAPQKAFSQRGGVGAEGTPLNRG